MTAEAWEVKMELLKLSKFKLQLRSLITEVRELREKERSATEEVSLLNQKQQQTIEEYGRKIQEQQADLAFSKELQQKLESKVSYLQDDNSFLENKQKELNRSLNSLLQSRESFISAYEDSICEMKRSIEARDRKLAFLSEKLKAHLLLFDSIEKEALSIRQVVGNVEQIVSEREEVVAGLKSKINKVSGCEHIFIEKICDLETKLIAARDALHRKDTIISQMEGELEAGKINNMQAQVEEISVQPLASRTLSGKEAIIQNLILEKKALYFELRSLEIILWKIQDSVSQMNEEDKGTFSFIYRNQKESELAGTGKDHSGEDIAKDDKEQFPLESSGCHTVEKNAASLHSRCNQAPDNDKLNCLLSESVCSEGRSMADIQSGSRNEIKDKWLTLEHQQDCGSSTTQTDMSSLLHK